MECDGVEGRVEAPALCSELTLLLQQHPDAIVAALNADGLVVDVPGMLRHGRRQLVDTRSALDLVQPSSLRAVVDAWTCVQATGSGSARVLLRDGLAATCHFFDVRTEHGVLVVVVVAEATTSGLFVSIDQVTAAPKTGRMTKDAVGTVINVDQRLCQMLDLTHAELIGRSSLDLIHPDDHARAIDAWLDLLARPAGSIARVRLRHRRGDGAWQWLDATNTNLLTATEQCVVADLVDIADEMAALEGVREREQLLTRLAEALPSGVLHIDERGKVMYSNSRLHTIVGTDQSETVEAQFVNVVEADRPILEAAVSAVLSQGDGSTVEIRLQVGSDSRLTLCSVTLRDLSRADGTGAGAVVLVENITDASRLRAELQRRATIDELTGCLNRAAILDELEQRVRRHCGGSEGTAVVFLDLDGFKSVNDTFGHRTGDQLLASAAARLRGAVRDNDLVGRLGGDEFLIIVGDVHSAASARATARRVQDALNEPTEVVEGLPIRIRASVGVAWSRDIDVVADTLVAAADRAMYEAKRAGDAQPVYLDT